MQRDIGISTKNSRGTVTALRHQVVARPRVIVALPDPLEGAMVCGWLKANNFEAVYRTNPAAAATEMQRPFDLLIADAMWAVGSALQSGARARNPLDRRERADDVYEPADRQAGARVLRGNGADQRG